jgi:hypothetical protein
MKHRNSTEPLVPVSQSKRRVVSKKKPWDSIKKLWDYLKRRAILKKNLGVQLKSPGTIAKGEQF